MSTTISRVLPLHWADVDGIVTVTPENEDRFSIRMRRAIEACRAAAEAEEFQAQFSLLLNTLATWLKSRADVESAYATLRDGKLLFLVVRRQAAHSREFDDELSDLDLQVARDPDLGLVRMDTLALPGVSGESLSSFLHPEFALAFPGR